MPLHARTISNYSTASFAPHPSGLAALIGGVAAASVLVWLPLPAPIPHDQSSLVRLNERFLSARTPWVVKGSPSPSPLVEVAQTKIDTAANVVSALNDLEARHPLLAAQFSDARKLGSVLPAGFAIPAIWTDGETEVVFEWIGKAHHAVVTFEGDGEFGYAMRQGSRFTPGAQSGKCADAPPPDLLNYIAEI
jgi:hypothetical protein